MTDARSPFALNDTELDGLFRNARTHRHWLSEPVGDDTLRRLYDLMKWGPTSANTCPARIVFLRTRDAKERLRPALSPNNIEKTMTAPVTAILGYDLAFFEKLEKLLPHNPAAAQAFASSPDRAELTAFRSGTLQGGYFILAARSVGLDCGPMSGFDNAAVDREFFAGTRIRSNFLCNLGHGDHAQLRPRAPRLEFDEACSLL